MRRRELIRIATIIPALSLVDLRRASTSAIAQQPLQSKRIGLLGVGDVSGGLTIFYETLQRLGWVEGKNLTIERRFWGSPERLRPSAADLVALRPDVLVGVGAAWRRGSD